MMRELLALLSEGKTLSHENIAERLHTTPEAIAARLDFLHHAGYLRKVCAVNDCGKKCAGCPLVNAAPPNVPAIWEAVEQKICAGEKPAAAAVQKAILTGG
jgi:DNA-binding Lrp family transcriptional regulator